MKLRAKKDATPNDGRGAPYCGRCGTAKTWSTEWQNGFDRYTGKAKIFHQWVCPRWAENPNQHDLGDNYTAVKP